MIDQSYMLNTFAAKPPRGSACLVVKVTQGRQRRARNIGLSYCLSGSLIHVRPMQGFHDLPHPDYTLKLVLLKLSKFKAIVPSGI
jgi:hypothetical protein